MLEPKTLQQQMLDGISAKVLDDNQLQSLINLIDTSDHASAIERLQVYRNNYYYLLTEALADSFPVIKKLIGEQCFNGIAKDFIAQHPPQQAALIYYGEQFDQILAEHSATKHLAYLPDIAKLEWHYLQAFHSADQQPIDISVLAKLAPEQLPNLCLRFNDSCQLLASNWPIQAIWHANIQEHVEQLDISDLPASKLLICRIEQQVQVIDLEPNCFNFALSLSKGNCIQQAWEDCLTANQAQQLPELTEQDLSQMLSYLFSLNLFCETQLIGN